MPETQPTGAPAAPVAPASATPQSAPSGDQVSRAELDALKTELVKAIEDQGNRTRQSQRDTIQDRVQAAVGGALPHFDVIADALKPLFKDGSNIEAVKQDLFIKSLMAQSSSQPVAAAAPPNQGPAPQLPPAGTGPTGLEAEIKAILEANKLTGAEPELVQLLTANRGQPWYQVGPQFAALATQIAGRSGTVLGTAAGSPSASPDLAREYVTKVQELGLQVTRGTLRSTEAQPAARRLRAEYRAKGVDVDSIIIGTPGNRDFAGATPI